MRVFLFMRMVLYGMFDDGKSTWKMSIICAVHTIYIDIYMDLRDRILHSFPVSFISVCIMSVLQLSTKNMFHVVNLKLYTIMKTSFWSEFSLFTRFCVFKVLFFIFFLLFHRTGPNNGSQFRALGLGQRPFLDAPFTTHLRDLESFRRKAPHTPISNFSSHSTSNGINSDCQGYKPNAPQIHGKCWNAYRKLIDK